MTKGVVHRNALPTGSRLNGYIIERVLVEPGGFGIVYLAKNLNIGKLVAIKEYFPSDLAMREGHVVSPKSPSHEDDFEWGLERFHDEAKSLACLSHPNIVHVLRYIEANGTGYMVMNYEEGAPLDKILERNKQDGVGLTAEELIQNILIPLLDGLKQVHKAWLLHSNINPGNIFVRRSDEIPVLLGFSRASTALAKHIGKCDSFFSPSPFMPFELYENGHQGACSDIYALGAVAYRIVTGNPPPDSVSRIKKDKMIPAVDVVRGRYSENLLRAIDHALVMDEQKRPQSYEDWAYELLNGQGRAEKSSKPDEKNIPSNRA